MLNPSPQALTAERRGFSMFEHAPGRETGRQWAQQDGLRPVLFNRGCGLRKRTEVVYHRHRFTGTSPRGAPRGPAAQLHPSEPFRVRVLGVPSRAVSTQDGLGRARTVEH